MKIQIKHNGKTYFIQGKAVRRQPSITPFESKAWKFDNLAKCQNVRDDVLEFFPRAVAIVS